MLSDKAISYALVDLFEYDSVQVSEADDAVQVMEQAGVPCALVHEGPYWAVQLDAEFIDERARRRTGAPARPGA